jgi:pimeloyl-ACP methyl ester carboxylesterase
MPRIARRVFRRQARDLKSAYRYFEITRNLDVSDLLAKVTVPTLVMHKRDDQVQPFEFLVANGRGFFVAFSLPLLRNPQL